jgi:transposase
MLYRRDLYGGEKRGFGIGKTKRGKGTKLMAMADGAGIPFAVHATSASPHEVTLVLDTLKERFLRQHPVRLIGDRAYDSDPLDSALAKQNIELISPHKFNRKKLPTQDGRVLRRYTRRWKIERLFAWLQNYRRLLVCHDYHFENFLGFVHLACILILMRRYF